MMRAVACLVLIGASSVAQAQGLPKEVCEQTATIASEAQELRVAGDTDQEAAEKLVATHEALGPAYTGQIIPVLVNYVYSQDAALLDQDFGAFWKETCLTADLSQVLAAD